MSAILAADDKRHGTYAGAVAHWREGSPLCGACRAAAARRRKLNRLRAHEGRPGLVPAIGTVRRLQALQAIGYGYPRIAAECGVSEKTLRNPTYRGQWVYRATAEKVTEVYERLSMTILEGPYATRSRNMAARKGWPPPLAWDDIDDPAETPTDWQHAGTDRHTELDDLLDSGAWLSEACRVLGLSVTALEKWADRNGRRADFKVLVSRERGAA